MRGIPEDGGEGGGCRRPSGAPDAPTATDGEQAKVTGRSASDATKSKDYSLTEGTYQIGNVIKTASGYTCMVTLPADNQKSYVDHFAKDERADFVSQGFSQIQLYFSYQGGAWTNTTTDQYIFTLACALSCRDPPRNLGHISGVIGPSSLPGLQPRTHRWRYRSEVASMRGSRTL